MYPSKPSAAHPFPRRRSNELGAVVYIVVSREPCSMIVSAKTSITLRLLILHRTWIAIA
jgi:hypothetical protein